MRLPPDLAVFQHCDHKISWQPDQCPHSTSSTLPWHFTSKHGLTKQLSENTCAKAIQGWQTCRGCPTNKALIKHGSKTLRLRLLQKFNINRSEIATLLWLCPTIASLPRWLTIAEQLPVLGNDLHKNLRRGVNDYITSMFALTACWHAFHHVLAKDIQSQIQDNDRDARHVPWPGVHVFVLERRSRKMFVLERF